eukprot:TRINITY_DN965_c0_g1_i1.p2 TRINITY_DN965_c0_g1~~TRINITY_DN965_c0_g1_i1.p2  ORF type:complete len:103 (-),score=10.31 TRINITY_DN965_c0_g1_i1:192-500(-)
MIQNPEILGPGEISHFHDECRRRHREAQESKEDCDRLTTENESLRAEVAALKAELGTLKRGAPAMKKAEVLTSPRESHDAETFAREMGFAPSDYDQAPTPSV